jgi:hypothetical protein
MAKLTHEEEAFQAMLEGDPGAGSPEMDRLVKLVLALDTEPRRGRGPSEDFRAALRSRIIAEAEQAARIPWRERVFASLREKNRAWRQSFRVVAAAGMAAVMLMGTGAVFAVAGSTKPGDLLHPAKLAREWLRLSVTRGPEQRGYLKLQLAHERLREIDRLLEAEVEEESLYSETFVRMDGAVLDATELLVRAFQAGAGTRPLDRLSRFAVAQRVDLESLLGHLPGAAQVDGRRSLEILSRIDDRVRAILAGCNCPANPLELPVGAVSGAPASAPPISCACKPSRRSDSGPSNGNQAEPPTGGGPNREPPPPPPPPGVDLVPGTDVDEPVNQLVDQVLDQLGITPPPTPTPSLSEAPAPSPAPSL